MDKQVDHRFTRRGVIDDLRMSIPPAVNRPEDDRLDDEPGRNGRVKVGRHLVSIDAVESGSRS